MDDQALRRFLSQQIAHPADHLGGERFVRKMFQDMTFKPTGYTNPFAADRPFLNNSQGGVSTELAFTERGEDGKYYNFPSIWGGKMRGPERALQLGMLSGQARGPFNTPEDAEKFNSRRWQMMERMLGPIWDRIQWAKNWDR